MGAVSSRELKNRTGEILRRVRRGERVVVTNRGRPVAVLAPADRGSAVRAGARTFEEAWSEIESAIGASRPRFPTWRDAMRRSRGRP